MKIDFGRLKDRSVILLAVSILFQIVSLIIYAATGVTQFTAELSTRVFVFGGLSLAMGVVIFLLLLLGIGGQYVPKALDIGIYVMYLFGLLAWVFYLTSEINYLTNVFVGIDGTKLTAVFILTVLTFLIAWIAALISAVLYRPAKDAKEEKTDE